MGLWKPSITIFDTNILGTNGGREKLIDFAPTLFRFDFVCMMLKNFKLDESIRGGLWRGPQKWKLTPYKIERFQNLRELIIRLYGGPVAQQDRASDS